VSRGREIIHGYGKNNYIETLTTTLGAVPDLFTCDWFNPEGSKATTATRDYEPIPLNAVVVKKWDNKVAPLENQVVFVTTMEVGDPFRAFDRYDERSRMENNLFKELTQNWHLEHPPKKTKEGVSIQSYTTMAMKALTTAFLTWQEQQLHREAQGKKSTWQMYRRKLKVVNRNKLIVFAGEHCGIFPSHEVFMLANVPVRDTEEELGINREQVYANYRKKSMAESS